MPNKQETLFTFIAIQKRFLTKEIVRKAFDYQKKAKSKGQQFDIIKYIKNNLQEEQIQAINEVFEKKYPSKLDSSEVFDSCATQVADSTDQNYHTPATQVDSTVGIHEKQFAHYDILKKIGQGGMGIVYKAYDTKLKRIVALKVILAEGASETQTKRFLQEAQATAKLDHPNIIKVYEVSHAPRIYFTMEYISGPTLRNLAKKQPLKYSVMAQIFYKITKAVDVAHQNGIIHRDIKPANIMITIDGNPKVMDFGLAKVDDGVLSQSGDTLGTPAYMAPEQADGKNIDFRVDIYAIGASLYELLTGRPPFEGESYFNIIHQIFQQDPIAPRKLNPDIPKDLEAICLKCLEKNPSNRYQKAKELALDLQNFLHNKPITAKAPTKFTVARKYVMRNKLSCSLIASALVILVMTTIWWFQSQRLYNTLVDMAENPNWQVRQAIAQTPIMPDNLLLRLSQDLDRRVRLSVASNEFINPAILANLVYDKEPEVRAEVAQNSIVPKEILERLSNDKEWPVRMAVAKNPRVSEELLGILAKDAEHMVRKMVALHEKTNSKILKKLSSDTNSEVRAAVASNPNTDISLLMQMTEVVRDAKMASLMMSQESPNSTPAPDNATRKIRACVVANPQTSQQQLQAFMNDPDERVRSIAIARSKDTDSQQLRHLLHENYQDELMRKAIAQNPNSDSQTLAELALDNELSIRLLVAKHKNVTPDILHRLSQDNSQQVCKQAMEKMTESHK